MNEAIGVVTDFFFVEAAVIVMGLIVVKVLGGEHKNSLTFARHLR